MSFLIKQGKTSISSLILFCIVGLVAAGAIWGAYSSSIKESQKLITQSELVNQDILYSLNWQVFKSKLNIFEVKYPRSWRLSVSVKGTGAEARETIIMQPKSAEGLDYAVFVRQDLEELNELSVAEKMAELARLHPENKKIDNSKVEGIVYINKRERIQALNAFMAGEKYLISLTYAGESVKDYSPEVYERYQGVFLRMLSTFKFL